MSYAVRKDGKGWRAVESKKDCTEDEVWQKEEPSPVEINPILIQIINLELTITSRRIREAVLGIDNGWLADINAQISELRKKL